MSGRKRLTEDAIAAFLAAHPAWERRGESLVRSFAFGAYAEGIAFVVRLGFAAEARDHHPELLVGFRQVTVTWSTHDAGGITPLDLEMAERTDLLARA